MMKEITIAVVDDHPLFREGVMRILSEIPGFRIVGEGSASDEALALCATLKPSILLMDISMPGGGLNAIVPILQENPGQKIIMLTVSETSDDVMSALSKGVPCQRRSKSRPVWRSKTRPAAGLWCRHGNGPDRGHFHVGGDDFNQGVRISPVSGSTFGVAWFCSALEAATRRLAADCFSR